MAMHEAHHMVYGFGRIMDTKYTYKLEDYIRDLIDNKMMTIEKTILCCNPKTGELAPLDITAWDRLLENCGFNQKKCSDKHEIFHQEPFPWE